MTLTGFCHWQNKTSPTIIHESQPQHLMELADMSAMLSVREQLTQLQKTMGMNVLEMAAILQVSRPTFYKWMELENPPIRKNNQERLNTICTLCNIWGQKKLGPLGSYLHKPIGTQSILLFDLLKNEILDKVTLTKYLDQIAHMILVKRRADQASEAALRKQGVTLLTKEERADRLDDVNFLD